MVTDPGQLRTINSGGKCLEYRLVRKAVRRLNLRISPVGEVLVSVPVRVPARRADAFVLDKLAWIEKHRSQPRETLLPMPDDEMCRGMLCRAVERVYPMVSPLGVIFPEIRVRSLKSQWGNCHWRQGYITLNRALCRCPQPLRDYVALHELVHFLYHDHGPLFYGCMDRLMPDWKQRRSQLRHYRAALDPTAE